MEDAVGISSFFVRANLQFARNESEHLQCETNELQIRILNPVELQIRQNVKEMLCSWAKGFNYQCFCAYSAQIPHTLLPRALP